MKHDERVKKVDDLCEYITSGIPIEKQSIEMISSVMVAQALMVVAAELSSIYDALQYINNSLRRE